MGNILEQIILFLLAVALICGLLLFIGWAAVKIWIGLLAGISFLEIMLKYQ